MKLFIKYMVSSRCKELVLTELKKLGVQSQYVMIDLGMVELLESITKKQRKLLEQNLRQSGLELLDSKKGKLIDKIKDTIVQMVKDEYQPVTNYSDYLSEKLKHDYTYMANIFSDVKGITIQQFIIINKIEKVKELLLYNELSLTEIANRMNYSSVAHLSHQFKKVTGLTPSFYKQIREKRESAMSDV
ncbi:MAG: helix-turn-helix domain-containing protein [Chitinophagaceae bacterium]